MLMMNQRGLHCRGAARQAGDACALLLAGFEASGKFEAPGHARLRRLWTAHTLVLHEQGGSGSGGGCGARARAKTPADGHAARPCATLGSLSRERRARIFFSFLSLYRLTFRPRPPSLRELDTSR